MFTLPALCLVFALGPSAGVGRGSVPDPAPTPPVSHVRAVTHAARSMLAEASARSATVARLVEALQSYRVLVFIDTRLDPAIPTGQTTLMTVTEAGRYVHVVLNPALPRDRRTELLGHELQHALEIASADDVIDPESMRRHFSEIGRVLGAWNRREESFETNAAVDVERQVRRELSVRGPIAP